MDDSLGAEDADEGRWRREVPATPRAAAAAAAGAPPVPSTPGSREAVTLLRTRVADLEQAVGRLQGVAKGSAYSRWCCTVLLRLHRL